MADTTSLFDEHGRVIRPVLTNTKADGSGDWVFPAGAAEETTGALIVVGHALSEVLEGHSFTCHYTQTVSDTDDKSIIAFKTPAVADVHVIIAASASTAATAYIYEAPTIDANEGDSLPVYNRCRDGDATTVIRTNTDPDEIGAMSFSETNDDHVTGGTVLASIPLVSGAGPKAIGGTARDTQEWVLKANTLYAFVLNSESDADNVHWIEVNFHEHEAI